MNSTNPEADLYYVSPESICKATYTIINPDQTTSIKTIDINTTENAGQYIVKGLSFKLEKDHW
jgi:hypothetical protein